MQDINQAREFTSALTGSDTSLVTFQVFYDPKPPHPQRPDLACTWSNTLDASVEFLNHRQSEKCGVYMCINGTDGLGREEHNITDLRVFFVDFDGQVEPEWVLQPHLIQKRDETHGHAFWLIDGQGLSKEDWTDVQKRLSLYYGTDGQVVDPARVVRVPGTLHYKNPNDPVSYSITNNLSDQLPRYSVTEVISTHPLPTELDEFLTRWSEAKRGIQDGVGYECNDHEIRNFIGFISNAAHPAVQGSGTFELIRVASYGHDHGIPLATTQELLWEHYNPRCLPPWKESERDHFNQVCFRAYKYATSAPGCKTIKAGLLALPLEEPTCGWDNQREEFGPKPVEEYLTKTMTLEDMTRKTNRLDHNSAEILMATLDAKSPHYDFARAFDGINFNGTDIVRANKQFYIFSGRSWRTVDDEVIKAKVQNSIAYYKPADSFTSGIFRVFCDLVTVETAENGTWLTDADRDTTNLAVFTNGIVDLGLDSPVLMPHTYEYFSFNELPYEYKPGAQCPSWQQFLTSIWDDNNVLKRQLQQWMGYCLTRDTSLQKFACLMGKPRAGKGVIAEVITNMIGEANVSSPSLSNLTKDSTLDNMSTSAVALIPDAHNVHINVRDAVLSNFKAITGEDSVSWHRMYKGGQSARMKLKFILSTNNIPDFVDPSGALVARMLLFPFYKSFIDSPDVTLKPRLMSEIEGILQWAIAGLRDLRANGNRFVEAEEGLVEKEEIREDMFPLAQYVNELCRLEPDVFTRLEDLYNGYRLWSISNGIKSPMSMVGFNKCLRNSALPIRHAREHGQRGFIGITVEAVGMNNVVKFPPVAR